MLNKQDIANQVNSFYTIHLNEMSQVKLMSRIDTKYWFHSDQLPAIFEIIKKEYYILSIDHEVLLPYQTVYYDTLEDRMYLEHHNGTLNRYKIRRRSYLLSGISFLEIKFKNNKGRTIKNRIPGKVDAFDFNRSEKEFLIEGTPYSPDQLKVSLINKFTRITLVNKNFKERCTIDLNLHYESENKSVDLNKLIILEIKSDGRGAVSPLSMALRDSRIKSTGFSKYCVGRTVTNNTLKRNAFKHKIRSIEKAIQLNNQLYNF